MLFNDLIYHPNLLILENCAEIATPILIPVFVCRLLN